MSEQYDVLGWSSTTWGMSEAEILQLFHPNAKQFLPPVEYRNPPRFSTIGIPELTIGGRSCIIYFFFDTSSNLNEVIIKPNEDKPYGCFETFLEMLVQKYGPATTSKKDDIADKFFWLFPSTAVELTRIDASALDMLLISIAYRPNQNHDLSFL